MKSYAKKLLAVTLASGTLASPIASASSAADTVKRNWKTIVGAALMGTGVVAGSAMIIVWLTKDSDKDALILDKLTADEKAALLDWKSIPVYCPSDLITANKQLEEGIKWVLNLKDEDFAKITSERGNAKIEEIFSIYPMPSCMQIGSEVLRDLFATPEGDIGRCKAILLRGLIKFATRIYAMGKVLAEGQKGNETFKFALKAIADLYVLMNKEGIELSEREKVHKQTILNFVRENYSYVPVPSAILERFKAQTPKPAGNATKKPVKKEIKKDAENIKKGGSKPAPSGNGAKNGESKPAPSGNGAKNGESKPAPSGNGAKKSGDDPKAKGSGSENSAQNPKPNSTESKKGNNQKPSSSNSKEVKPVSKKSRVGDVPSHERQRSMSVNENNLSAFNRSESGGQQEQDDPQDNKIENSNAQGGSITPPAAVSDPLLNEKFISECLGEEFRNLCSILKDLKNTEGFGLPFADAGNKDSNASKWHKKFKGYSGVKGPNFTSVGDVEKELNKNGRQNVADQRDDLDVANLLKILVLVLKAIGTDERNERTKYFWDSIVVEDEGKMPEEELGTFVSIFRSFDFEKKRFLVNYSGEESKRKGIYVNKKFKEDIFGYLENKKNADSVGNENFESDIFKKFYLSLLRINTLATCMSGDKDKKESDETMISNIRKALDIKEFN